MEGQSGPYKSTFDTNWSDLGPETITIGLLGLRLLRKISLAPPIDDLKPANRSFVKEPVQGGDNNTWNSVGVPPSRRGVAPHVLLFPLFFVASVQTLFHAPKNSDHAHVLLKTMYCLNLVLLPPLYMEFCSPPLFQRGGPSAYIVLGLSTPIFHVKVSSTMSQSA